MFRLEKETQPGMLSVTTVSWPCRSYNHVYVHIDGHLEPGLHPRISEDFFEMNVFFFGYFDPINMYFDNEKKNYFWDDLSDISAKTASRPRIPRPRQHYLPGNTR